MISSPGNLSMPCINKPFACYLCDNNNKLCVLDVVLVFLARPLFVYESHYWLTELTHVTLKFFFKKK